MLKLEGLKLAPEEKEAALHRRAARLLRIPEEDVLSVQVLRRSIDAREELHLVYTVAAEVRQEKQVLRRCRDRRVSRFAPERYALPEVLSSPEVPPVVAAASEPGRVVTNGMSHYARSGENINGGMLVGVTPEDFGTDHPLAGVAWQRQLEEAAFRLGGGGFLAPCQRVEDFLAHRPSTGPGAVLPSYRPGVTWCDLHDCLPSFLTGAMEEALPLLERKLRGYAQPDALLTAVETRSSSPVRILRDESGQSALRGLYPCGEGAGYAGGILSAAADGMRCAEKIWEVYS